VAGERERTIHRRKNDKGLLSNAYTSGEGGEEEGGGPGDPGLFLGEGGEKERIPFSSAREKKEGGGSRDVRTFTKNQSDEGGAPREKEGET